jgi:hypothetical protein
MHPHALYNEKVAFDVAVLDRITATVSLLRTFHTWWIRQLLKRLLTSYFRENFQITKW